MSETIKSGTSSGNHTLPVYARTLLYRAEQFGLIIVWLVMLAVFGYLRPETFLTWANFSTILGSQSVLVVVTHLHHLGPDAVERDEQTATLLAWLEEAEKADATIVMGDFNADPDEPAPARLRAAGFRSGFAEANGHEPAVTWPSGLQAPAMDTDGEPECLDYIWLRGAVRVDSARLVFDRPDAIDPTLYASDHLGIAAHLEIG